MNWAELREEEFADAVKESGGVCIIPVGCYEMHGQHLPVRTDVYQAEAIAREAAKLEPACVFPAFEFGDSNDLVEWKGAIRLDPELMLEMLECYCTEIARHGFNKIILLNYHGGNAGFLRYFCNMLDYKQRDFTVMYMFPVPLFVDEIWPTLQEKGYDYYPELLPEDVEVIRDFVENKRLDGHGGLLETATMLAIRPDLVRMDRLGAVDGHFTHKTDRVSAAGLSNPIGLWRMEFPNSYCGDDPHNANERIGRLCLRLAAEKVAKGCRVFKEEYGVFQETIDMKRPYYNK